MTYKDLASNPIDGTYRTESGKYIYVHNGNLIHVPHTVTFQDDEELERV